MELINEVKVQQLIDSLKDQELYIHLEMVTVAYAAHFDSSKHPAANFISNAKVSYYNALVTFLINQSLNPWVCVILGLIILLLSSLIELPVTRYGEIMCMLTI